MGRALGNCEMIVELEIRFIDNDDNAVFGSLASVICDDKPCDESFKKMAEFYDLDEELLKTAQQVQLYL